MKKGNDMSNEEETPQAIELESAPEPTTDTPGIRITKPPPTEVRPPLEAEELQAQMAEEELPAEIGVMTEGKIPLEPAVVTPIIRFEGILLAEMTKYKGWIYTEKEIEAIERLIVNCGFSAPPMLQLGICISGLHLAKGGGYILWRRSGKPDSMRLGAEDNIQSEGER